VSANTALLSSCNSVATATWSLLAAKEANHGRNIVLLQEALRFPEQELYKFRFSPSEMLIKMLHSVYWKIMKVNVKIRHLT